MKIVTAKEKKGNVRKRLNDALLEVFLCVNIYILNRLLHVSKQTPIALSISSHMHYFQIIKQRCLMFFFTCTVHVLKLDEPVQNK